MSRKTREVDLVRSTPVVESNRVPYWHQLVLERKGYVAWEAGRRSWAVIWV